MSDPPSGRLAVLSDHDIMRDAFRHFLDATNRLSEAYGFVSRKEVTLPAEFIVLLDGAISDLNAARDALRDAAIGTCIWTGNQDNQS